VVPSHGPSLRRQGRGSGLTELERPGSRIVYDIRPFLPYSLSFRAALGQSTTCWTLVLEPIWFIFRRARAYQAPRAQLPDEMFESARPPVTHREGLPSARPPLHAADQTPSERRTGSGGFSTEARAEPKRHPALTYGTITSGSATYCAT